MLKLFAVKGSMVTEYREGVPVPCTVLEPLGNSLLRSSEGYDLVSTFRSKSLNKPQLREFNLPFKVRTVRDDYLGQDRTPLLIKGSFTSVDVRGVPKGKGFLGVMKRYGFKGQSATRQSLCHRRIGSVGAIKGKI